MVIKIKDKKYLHYDKTYENGNVRYITFLTNIKDVEEASLKVKVGDVIIFGDGRNYLIRIDARDIKYLNSLGLKKGSKFELKEY